MFGDIVESRISDEREETRAAFKPFVAEASLATLAHLLRTLVSFIFLFFFFFFFGLLLYRLWMSFRNGSLFTFALMPLNINHVYVFVFSGSLFSLYVRYDIPMHRMHVCVFF
ncbi:hypothetical protein BGX38DRAFT_825946 [Terfezia claveryi]|nr:hypothetical protein BGX38DRAFT_825946 [Terfezia claveryi]